MNENNSWASLDMDNPKHEPHVDLFKKLDDLGGIDQVRISESGDVIGGTTRIGKVKMDWEAD